MSLSGVCQGQSGPFRERFSPVAGLPGCVLGVRAVSFRCMRAGSTCWGHVRIVVGPIAMLTVVSGSWCLFILKYD